MRIGILGGTFDPVHLGHLRAVEEVREKLDLKRVILLPANIPPHKRDAKITPAEDRLRMLQLAVEDNRFLEVSDAEIKRGGVSYTIETIMEFERTGDDIFYLLGVDSFHEIDSWHRYEELFEHANFVVMERPSKRRFMGIESFPERIRKDFVQVGERIFKHTSSKLVYVIPVTQIDVSSSFIRECLKRGQSIKYLVPEKVETYIYQRRLYTE